MANAPRHGTLSGAAYKGRPPYGRLGVNEVKRLKQKNYLRKKFDELDNSGDGRVDAKELKKVCEPPPQP